MLISYVINYNKFKCNTCCIINEIPGGEGLPCERVGKLIRKFVLNPYKKDQSGHDSSFI